MELQDFPNSNRLRLLTRATAPVLELIGSLGFSETLPGTRMEKPFHRRTRNAIHAVIRSIGGLGILVLVLGLGMALIGLYGLLSDFGNVG